MSDRELLELAAKAAGIEVRWERDESMPFQERWQAMITCGWEGQPSEREWNPLRESDDAFKLAVTLGIAVTPYPIYARPKHSVIAKQYSESMATYRGEPDASIEDIELYGDNADAATRRVIVKVAAKIGARQP